MKDQDIASLVVMLRELVERWYAIVNKECLNIEDSLQSESLSVRKMDRPETHSEFSCLHFPKPLSFMLLETFSEVLSKRLSNIEQLCETLAVHLIDGVYTFCLSFWFAGTGSNWERPFPVDLEPFHVPHYTDRRHRVSTTNRLSYDFSRALDMLISWAQA